MAAKIISRTLGTAPDAKPNLGSWLRQAKRSLENPAPQRDGGSHLFQQSHSLNASWGKPEGRMERGHW